LLRNIFFYYDINCNLSQNERFIGEKFLMRNVDDTGKIWLLGSVKPEYAVRIGCLYIIVGEGDSQSIMLSLYENHLFVALHYPENQSRLFRRIPLYLEANSKGTLFNGFTKTRHADIKAITYQDKEVEEYWAKEKDCFLDKDGKVDPIKIKSLAGWN
jgi:hypothetical protein